MLFCNRHCRLTCCTAMMPKWAVNVRKQVGVHYLIMFQSSAACRKENIFSVHFISDCYEFIANFIDYDIHDLLQREIDVRSKNQPALAKKGAKEVDDLFSDVFGKEKHGHVRGLGLGPAPTHIWNEAPSPAVSIRIATEARKKAEEETKEMKERMIVMETQLAEMKAMMATILQNKTTDLQQSNYTPTNPVDGRQNIVDANNPNDAFEGEVQSSSSNHQFQSYQVHQTKKRRVRYEHESENNPEHGEKEVLLMSVGQPHRPVARGLLFSKNPSTIVGGERLGHQYWEIYVEVVMIPTESLIRSYQGMKTICDAARKNIAWPSYLVKPVKRLN